MRNLTGRKSIMKRVQAVVLAVLLLAAAFPVNAYAYAKKIGTSAEVADGYYRLIPSCATSRVLTVAGQSKANAANIYIYKKSETKLSQIFYIRSIGSGLYTIRNVNSGKYVEVASGKKTNRANIRQNAVSAKNRQKWYIIKKSGKYVFQASYCKKVMTVKQSKKANKTNVYTYSYLGISGQKWKLENVSADTVASLTTAKTAASATTTASAKLQALSGYKTSSRVWSDAKDLPIMTNIIGAVESGGQVYGKRNYAAYAAPYANSSIEYTCTLGWAQFYGSEAKQLIVNIYNKNKTAFTNIVKKYYPLATEKSAYDKFMEKVTTSYNWVSKKYNPASMKSSDKEYSDKDVLIALISSANGKTCQDELFQSEMKTMITYCKSTYTSNAWAVHMYCEIRHLGGAGAANRIFNKCKTAGSYRLGMIMAALKADQSDTSSSNQVGDTKFWSRHVKCAQFLQTYAA